MNVVLLCCCAVSPVFLFQFLIFIGFIFLVFFVLISPNERNKLMVCKRESFSNTQHTSVLLFDRNTVHELNEKIKNLKQLVGTTFKLLYFRFLMSLLKWRQRRRRRRRRKRRKENRNKKRNEIYRNVIIFLHTSLKWTHIPSCNRTFSFQMVPRCLHTECTCYGWIENKTENEVIIKWIEVTRIKCM